MSVDIEDFDEEFDEDSMPVPCQRCQGWFDLHDGCGSEKWYPGTVICSDCSAVEQTEMALDNDIQDEETLIEDAEHTLRTSKVRLAKLMAKRQ